MADTIRTRAALLALLADNVTGDISAQDLRDLLVSLHGVYGEIYVEDGAVAQLFTTTPSLLTCWSGVAGANGVNAGVISDKANNRIAIDTDGVYNVEFNASLNNGDTGTTYKFYIRVNAVEQSVGTYVKCGNADVVNVGTSRLLSLTAGDLVTIYGESDVLAGKNITVTDAVMHVERHA